jgi:hypothetical protein
VDVLVNNAGMMDIAAQRSRGRQPPLGSHRGSHWRRRRTSRHHFISRPPETPIKRSAPMSYLETSDHPELFVAHGFEEHLVDLDTRTVLPRAAQHDHGPTIASGAAYPTSAPVCWQ